MRARTPSIVGFLTWLVLGLCPASAWAAPPRVRTSVVPTVGVDGQVHERVSVGTVLRVPVLAEDPTGVGDVASFDGGVFTRVRIKSAFGVSAGYGARVGRWPLDGPWSREHRLSIGLMVSTPERGRLLGVSHRTRVETRFVRDTGPWVARARLRTETALVLSFRPWMQMSLPVELLASPQAPRADILQLRAGLGLGGSAPVGQREDAEEARPAARLRWLAAARAGLWPVALSEARGLPAAELDATQQAVDLVVTLGFGVSL